LIRAAITAAIVRYRAGRRLAAVEPVDPVDPVDPAGIPVWPDPSVTATARRLAWLEHRPGW
jgi:hypothetical protein